MRKNVNVIVILTILFVLTGCGVIGSQTRIDFKNCIEEECEDSIESDVTLAYLEDIFEDDYRDLLYEDDVDVVVSMEKTDSSYKIILLYTEFPNPRYYDGISSGLDLYYQLTTIEDELKQLNVDKDYAIEVIWKNDITNVELDEMHFELIQSIEQGEEPQLYSNLTDNNRDYDIVLSEILAFLGSYELMFQYEGININISILTSVGSFNVRLDVGSTEYLISYIAEESVTDEDIIVYTSVFEDIMLQEKRSEYTVVIDSQ